MNNREVMQQALEALEGLFGLPNQWESGGVAVWRLGGSDASRQAITALKAALKQQAEPVACQSCQDIGGNWAWKCNLCGEVDESREPEPPQRHWVGLEIEEVQDSYNSDYQAQTRAVEKLLKERNA